MKKGIQRRLVWSYLLLVIFTVVLFETVILSGMVLYYQGGMKQSLRDQGAMFSSFYEQELITGSFEEKAEELLNQYNFLIHAQVQLINQNGDLLADTHRSQHKNILHLEDVKQGLEGETSYYFSEHEGEKVLSVTYPLKAGAEQVGAIRFTTSLEPLYEVFFRNTLLLLSAGGVVIVLAFLLGYFLATTITKPVKKITMAAEEMAAGKFSTRIQKKNNDEIGRLADTLNFMAEKVQEHEQFKNQFIASVSHDLRTPLTSIKGWAITLHSMTEDRFLQEGLETITNESDRLNHLVTDLLDLSSMSTGKLAFEFNQVDMIGLIQEVVLQIKPRVEEKDITLCTDLHEKHVMVMGDRNRLKQVMINLLDNALKFTPSSGKITIQLKKEDRSIAIRIADTGIGISKGDLKDIKEKFFKGKTKDSGTGLGLAICEEIMKGHRGEFVMESEEGNGTTATIILPL